MPKAQPRERHLVRGQSYRAHTIRLFGERHLGIAAVENPLCCDGGVVDGHGTNMRMGEAPHFVCGPKRCAAGVPIMCSARREGNKRPMRLVESLRDKRA